MCSALHVPCSRTCVRATRCCRGRVYRAIVHVMSACYTGVRQCARVCSADLRVRVHATLTCWHVHAFTCVRHMCPVRVLCYMSMRSRARDSHTRCGLQACPCNMVSDFCACDKSVLVRRCARAHHISVHVIVCCSNVRVCCVHVRACASRCWQQRALCMSHACVCPLLEYACVSLLVCSCAYSRDMSRLRVLVTRS